MLSKNNKYAAIHNRIRKYKENFAARKMNNLLDMKGGEKNVAVISKYVKVNACGCMPLSHVSYVEQELMKWIEELWRD